MYEDDQPVHKQVMQVCKDQVNILDLFSESMKKILQQDLTTKTKKITLS